MPYFLAHVVEEYTDDNGKTKNIRSQYLVDAYSVTEAETIVHEEFKSSTVPFHVSGVTQTKIVDVLEPVSKSVS